METIAKIKEVFAEHKLTDENGMDFVPRCNVQQALWDLNINPLFADLDAAIVKADADQDGKINLTEFKTFYLSMYRDYATNPQRALTLFMELDLNANGYLTADELRAAVCGEDSDALLDDEFEAFWDAINLDKNETICAAEFVVFVCPNVTATELNRYLEAYGLDPNAEEYVKVALSNKEKEKRSGKLKVRGLKGRKKTGKDKSPPKKVKRITAATANVNDEKRREQEERERKEREEQQAQQRERERKRREEEAAGAKKREDPKAAEKKKDEGGCCVVS